MAPETISDQLSRLVRGATVVVSSALLLALATGGGDFELGGRRWLSLHSLDRLMLIWIVLMAIQVALGALSWRIRSSGWLRASLALRPDRSLLLVLMAGVGLRLTQYIAPPIELLPYLPTEVAFGRFVLTNVFVVGGTLFLHALGRHLEDCPTGLLAVILFTLSPWTIFFGRFHLQQAAAFGMGMLAAFCFLRWVNKSGAAIPAVAFATVAILLDSLNFHLLALVLAMWSGSQRSWREMFLVLGVLLGLSSIGRLTFVPAVDLWLPSIPPVTALTLSPATLLILYDRFLTLLLPAGASLLFLVGMLRVGTRRHLIVPAWVAWVVIWTVWVDNHHLVQSAIYHSVLAAGSLAAARGASWILAVSNRALLWRNLGWITIVGLLFSVWPRHEYVFHRIYRWNTAVVSDRDSLPIAWMDGFRAHGAWYLMTSVREGAEFPDRRFLEAMTASYGVSAAFGRVLFPILRPKSDYYQPPGALMEERVPLRWEAEELRSKVGRIVPDGAAANGYAIRADRAGAVLHGPYQAYPAGEYAIDFRVRIATRGRQDGVGYVDVARDRGREVLARRELTVDDFRSDSGYREISLAVTLDRSEPIEFRVFSAGRASLWVDRVRVRLGHMPPPSR